MVGPFTLHFVYLSQAALQPEWQHIRDFLEPESLEKGQALVICRDLDIGHHVFAKMLAKDWTVEKGTQPLLLRYDLVASILEIRRHTNPPGFVDLAALREQLAVGSVE